MTGPWTLTAAAGDVDASDRAAFAGEMLRWIDGGGVGVALCTDSVGCPRSRRRVSSQATRPLRT